MCLGQNIDKELRRFSLTGIFMLKNREFGGGSIWPINDILNSLYQRRLLKMIQGIVNRESLEKESEKEKTNLTKQRQSEIK